MTSASPVTPVKHTFTVSVPSTNSVPANNVSFVTSMSRTALIVLAAIVTLLVTIVA